MSKSIEALFAEREQLEKRMKEIADAMKSAVKSDEQRKKIVAEMRKKIEVYSITPIQLFPELRKKREARTGEAVVKKAKSMPMYIKDGKEWTGKGRAPNWWKDIPEADREKYKVKP